MLWLRLAAGSFWRRYPKFTLFVACLFAESLILAMVRSHGAVLYLYGELWIVTRAMCLILEAAAVIEIFSRWSENFPGIESFGRRLFLFLVLGAGALVAATLPVDATRGGWVLAYRVTSVANREAHLFLAVFLAMMLVFFRRFGGPVGPNLRRHARWMLLFLAANSVAYLSVTVGRMFGVSNMLLPAVSFLCLGGWLLAFRRGEDVAVEAQATPEELAEYEAADALSRKLIRFGERISVRGMLGLK